MGKNKTFGWGVFYVKTLGFIHRFGCECMLEIKEFNRVNSLKLKILQEEFRASHHKYRYAQPQYSSPAIPNSHSVNPKQAGDSPHIQQPPATDSRQYTYPHTNSYGSNSGPPTNGNGTGGSGGHPYLLNNKNSSQQQQTLHQNGNRHRY